MQHSILSQIRQIPHPARAVLKEKYRLTNTQIGKYLGLHPHYAGSFLTGHLPCPVIHSEKLYELVTLLEMEKGAQA